MPIAILALALGTFGIGTTEFVIMGMLPIVGADLGVDVPTAGQYVSSYAMGVVVGAPLLTALTVRLARRWTLVGLLVLFTLGNLLSALAPTHEVLLATRFLTGLPHGAFFGVGVLVAASLVAPSRRGRAMATVVLGLTIANVVGVPGGTFIAQQLGWRWTFAAIALVGVVATIAVAAFAPRGERDTTTTGSLRAELAAFARPQVLLTLAVVIFGLGGLFASYSYVAPMLTDVSGLAESSVPWVLVLVGVGMTAGSYLGGRMSDRSTLATLAGGLVLVIAVLLALTVLLDSPVAAVVLLVLLGFGSLALGPAIQMRIVEQAGGAPTMVSAGVQSAFNIANSIGAWLGGAVIAAGAGLRAPNLVGAALAVVGLVILGVSGFLEIRERRTTTAQAEPVPAAA
ncbi:MFS transporter, DHA1 family, inner membrane transport protein [Georgenia satyanarayanai]|uniref:MFS transporter, DHA1 family, inner membrane transport protein n=1 Tax=Georgenia satyanarayanai TaxID=860221 RepID=A0A2Y8ZX08_9MICO|nr:MFS transporter [Georgenia satyanarayanai]PYG01794.1 DHA1 family inner membrane transport protein [Georgenia satyanarayanai]SSA36594.1 MFS transporter, DHA1 family, inner membrane transport protein [Georgenia satyanarayanai]